MNVVVQPAERFSRDVLFEFVAFCNLIQILLHHGISNISNRRYLNNSTQMPSHFLFLAPPTAYSLASTFLWYYAA